MRKAVAMDSGSRRSESRTIASAITLARRQAISLESRRMNRVQRDTTGRAQAYRIQNWSQSSWILSNDSTANLEFCTSDPDSCGGSRALEARSLLTARVFAIFGANDSVDRSSLDRLERACRAHRRLHIPVRGVHSTALARVIARYPLEPALTSADSRRRCRHVRPPILPRSLRPAAVQGF